MVTQAEDAVREEYVRCYEGGRYCRRVRILVAGADTGTDAVFADTWWDEIDTEVHASDIL